MNNDDWEKFGKSIDKLIQVITRLTAVRGGRRYKRFTIIKGGLNTPAVSGRMEG